MSEEQGEEASFLALPQHILSLCFEAALRLHEAALRDASSTEQIRQRRRDPRRVLPLVSRSFNQAAAEADALWRRVQLNLLTLTPEGVPRLARWLDAHAPAIQVLVLYGRALPAVAAALAGAVGALAAAVSRAGALQQLELPSALAAPMLARLQPQALPCLRSVAVDLAGSGSSSSGSGSRVWRGSSGGPGELKEATANLLALPALSELHIQSCFDAGLLALHPALQQRLRRLHFADARDVPRAPALDAIARLSALTTLRFYQRDGLQLPGPLTALPRLAHLHAAVRYRDDPLAVGEDIGALSTLRALWLQHAVFERPAGLAAALPGLHTLGLVGGGESYPAVLAGLVAAAGGPGAACPLRALRLEAHASAVAEVPEAAWQALAQLGAGLTRLELPYCRLRALPEGSYLDSLQVLDLSQNSLPGVPAALAAARQLRALSLGQQEAAAPGESEADVATLAVLPALRLVVSSAGHYSNTHMSVGLRSPAEAAHTARLRAALPPAVRVTNSQPEFERSVGRLQSVFEVAIRQERAAALPL